jgi:Zn-dependent oligopeptidase
MLNFSNHAALVTSTKMTHNPETVFNLYSDLKERLLPLGQKEVSHMLDLKKIDVGNSSFDGKFYYWDKDYYGRKVLNDEYNVNTTLISE